MHIWHLTPDAPRLPHRVSPGVPVTLRIGTWPIEPGQSIWITCQIERSQGITEDTKVNAVWQYNHGANSYWHAELGPFAEGDRVSYTGIQTMGM